MDSALADLTWRSSQALDLAAPFQPWAAAGLALLALGWLLRGRRARAAGAAALAGLLAWGLGPVWAPLSPPAAPGAAAAAPVAAGGPAAAEVTLAVANLRRDNPWPDAARDALLSVSPDLAAMVETPPPLLVRLESAFADTALPRTALPRPYWMLFSAAAARPVRVAPRAPPAPGRPPAYATYDLDLGAGRTLRVLIAHFASPATANHAEQRAWLPHLAPLRRDPMVVAGDFNAVPWSRTPDALARALDLRPAGGWRPTWLPRLGPLAPLTEALRPWLGLPIDQVLVSGGVEVLSVDRLAVPGSDHLAQVIRLRVTPPPAALSAPSSPRPPSAPSR